jgi:hypothetical protein
MVKKSPPSFYTNASFPGEIPRKAEFLRSNHVGVAWFSDTILLYTRRDDDQAKGMATVMAEIRTTGKEISGFNAPQQSPPRRSHPIVPNNAPPTMHTIRLINTMRSGG